MSAFLYATTRTPFGRFNGALAQVRPDDLAAAAITSTLARVPDLDPAAIDDVVWGNASRPARRTATSAAWRRCSPGFR